MLRGSPTEDMAFKMFTFPPIAAMKSREIFGNSRTRTIPVVVYLVVFWLSIQVCASTTNTTDTNPAQDLTTVEPSTAITTNAATTTQNPTTVEPSTATTTNAATTAPTTTVTPSTAITTNDATTAQTTTTVAPSTAISTNATTTTQNPTTEAPSTAITTNAATTAPTTTVTPSTAITTNAATTAQTTTTVAPSTAISTNATTTTQNTTTVTPSTAITTNAATTAPTTTVTPSTAITTNAATTQSPVVKLRNDIAEAGNNSKDVVKAFDNIQGLIHNKHPNNQGREKEFSKGVGDGISDLTKTLTSKNFSRNDWINITDASINLSSDVKSKMTNVKLALNNLIMVTSDKILDSQPPDKPFYLNNTYAGVAGLKSNPDNLDGFQLETNYGDLIVPPDMNESESPVSFKMVCYNDDTNIDPILKGKTKLSTVFVSIVNSENKPIPNSDPDKTYKIVLKSKDTVSKNWQDVKNPGGISGFKIPLMENGLSLVELSFTDCAVWGKLNEAPTKYNYHFYYSVQKDNNVENIIKVPNIKIAKYGSVLRIIVQSTGPQNSLYLLVDSKELQRLKKRAVPASLRTRTSTIQPLVKKGSFVDKYEPFNIKDTSIDKNYNVILKTNLFGTFTSVISSITPMKLDLAKIFVDFNKKVLNNPYVLIVLLLIFLLYCILAVIVRRLDKKDQINWLYLPLSDNNNSDPCQYLIRVHTGVRSSRVVSATPYFILRGMKGETDIRILSDGVRKNLGSGTVSDFLLRTCENLGTLLTLKIWHDNEGSSPRLFLSDIDIKDVTNNRWYSFPCNDWLAFDKGDGSIIRQLEPHSNQSKNVFSNIKTRIHIGLFDDHLYFSIVKRPRSSHFTRVQRLSTLVAVLYLSLISSAMYYKPNDKTPSRAFTFGPFTLSSKEIVVGMISSVIMILPTSIIITLFKCRKVKGEELDTRGQNSLTIIERLKQIRLPWWSVFLAYLLVFLSIGVSAFFTFMYSIVWGKKLALKWLLSIVINVTGSVILVQPLKIITLAMLASCILESPQQDHEDSKSYFTEESEDIPPVEVKICLPPNMSTKSWKDKKRTMKLNNKLSSIFQSLSFNLFYVVICFLFLANERVNTKFYQNNAIKLQLQIGNLKQTDGCDAIWNWIMQYAVPVIFPYKGYNGQILTINSQRFLADQANLRLGAVRFRQIRNRKGWIRNVTKAADIQAAFRYTSSEDSGEEFEQMGVLEDYQNGGYIIDINHRYLKAKSILLRLRTSNWLDEHTHCLFVCFNTYNANTGLYMQTVIQMEKLFLGNVLSVIKVVSFKLYPFVDLMDYLMLLILIVFVCITIANIVILVRYVVKTSELLSWMVFRSLLRLISALLIIIGYILRIDRLLDIRDKLIANPEKYISGDALIFQERIFLAGLCGYILVTTLNLCQPLSMNYYFFLMKASIMLLLPYLNSFIIILAVVISSFSFSTYVLFYTSMLSFHTLKSAYLTLFRVFLSMTKFHQVFKKNTAAIHFIFSVYTLFTAIILMNICVSMLNESFALIKKIQREIGSQYKFDWELNQHFWTQLMAFFRSKKNTKTTEKEMVEVTKNEDTSNSFDTLSMVDKMLSAAICHHDVESKETQLKYLTLYHMIYQCKHAQHTFEIKEIKIEIRPEKQVANKLRAKKEKNGNNTWTYWYYQDDCHPLLKISFPCEDEDPGEIICGHVFDEEDILSKTQNGLISYTLLGPTIEIVSNILQDMETNEYEIVYFCKKPLHHYYCCEMLQSSDGTMWLGNSPQQMPQAAGVEELILQDVVHVKELPGYLTLVRRPRREYICWDNKNGEKVSLLEPSLSLSLSPRDISKTKCSAILKMEFEDQYPVIALTLNVDIEDPIIVRFQKTKAIENSSSQLYTQTSTKEWNEESQVVKDNISFKAKPRAHQETRHMLRPSQIKWDWRNEIKCLKDPLNEKLFRELSRRIGNNWEELGENLGIPPQAILRIKNSTSMIHPEMACFEVLTQWNKFSVMSESKIKVLKSALSIINEDLSQSIEDIAEKYENSRSTFIQESVKTKFFDQISRSEIMVPSWKELAKRLGLSKTDIEKIDKCTILTVREKCYNALMSWEAYNKETLRQQLTEMGFSFLAGKVPTDERK